MTKTINKQGGFTLVELVIVMTILGILAVYLVPAYINLVQQARIATVESMAGTLASAVNLAQSEYIAQANFTASTVPVAWGGQTLNINVNQGAAGVGGVPQQGAGGIGAMIYSPTLNGVGTNKVGYIYTAGSAGSVADTFDLAAGLGSASAGIPNCYVTYLAPTGSAGTTQVAINAVTTGC